MHPPRTAHLCPLLAVALLAGACSSVHYTRYPASLGVATHDDEDPNNATVSALTKASLRWAVQNYPPQGDRYAINLPTGLRRERYLAVAADLGPAAEPLTEANDHLPTYHVGRIWVRSDRAKVDVTRPVFSLGNTTDPLEQTTTLWLRRSGLNTWRVEHTQPWAIGVVPTPEPYHLPPEPDRTARTASRHAPNPATEPTPETREPERISAAEPAEPTTEAPIWLPPAGDPFIDALMRREPVLITVEPTTEHATPAPAPAAHPHPVSISPFPGPSGWS